MHHFLQNVEGVFRRLRFHIKKFWIAFEICILLDLVVDSNCGCDPNVVEVAPINPCGINRILPILPAAMLHNSVTRLTHSRPTWRPYTQKCWLLLLTVCAYIHELRKLINKRMLPLLDLLALLFYFVLFVAPLVVGFLHQDGFSQVFFYFVFLLFNCQIIRIVIFT